MKACILASTLLLTTTSIASAQEHYKRELADSLVKRAKVAESAAAAAAHKRVPAGVIQSVELERENGGLIYSYDIKTPGKSGIDEVHVSAVTGAIVAFEHETPAMEKKEAAADATKGSKARKTKP